MASRGAKTDLGRLIDFIDLLNWRGGEVVALLERELDKPENEEALAWLAVLWEPAGKREVLN